MRCALAPGPVGGEMADDGDSGGRPEHAPGTAAVAAAPAPGTAAAAANGAKAAPPADASTANGSI